MLKYCPKFSGLAYTAPTDTKRLFTRLRCKMWQCPYCHKVNQKQWRAALFRQLPGLGTDWSFHTITLPAELHESRMTAQRIKNNWDKLMKRLKRMYGKFSYVRVLEQHSTGNWHVHLLASFLVTDLKTKWHEDGTIDYQYSDILKRETFPDCGFGYMCSAANLTHNGETSATQKAIGYVTKYMTKRDEETESDAKAVNLRMIQTSRDIKFKGDASEETWYFKHAIYLEDILDEKRWYDLNEDGYRVSYEDFEETWQYPPK